MIKRKLMKVLFISACMVTLTSSTAFASVVVGQTTATCTVGETTASSAGSQTTTASAGGQEINNKLYDKQLEIDKYLFEDHAKEIESMGFQVTSTFATESFIEIGITPYSDENADYLYKAFGTELVKVVKGDQAVILDKEIMYMQAPDTAVASTDVAEPVKADAGVASEVDASKAADSGMATTVVDDTKAADTSVIDDSQAAEMEITSAEDTSAVAVDYSAANPEVLAYASGEAITDTQANTLVPVVLACAAGMVVIIGGTALWIKKRKNFSR